MFSVICFTNKGKRALLGDLVGYEGSYWGWLRNPRFSHHELTPCLKPCLFAEFAGEIIRNQGLPMGWTLKLPDEREFTPYVWGYNPLLRKLSGLRWTESIWPHFETMVETITFVGIYRGIIRNQGFLGGAKWISPIHSRFQ